MLSLKFSVWIADLVPKLPSKLYQTSHRDPGRPFSDPGLVVFHPSGAGDIEMDPGSVFCKFFQEHGRSARAAPAPAGIHDIGDIRLDLLFVLIVERQAPHF